MATFLELHEMYKNNLNTFDFDILDPSQQSTFAAANALLNTEKVFQLFCLVENNYDMSTIDALIDTLADTLILADYLEKKQLSEQATLAIVFSTITPEQQEALDYLKETKNE